MRCIRVQPTEVAADSAVAAAVQQAATWLKRPPKMCRTDCVVEIFANQAARNLLSRTDAAARGTPFAAAAFMDER